MKTYKKVFLIVIFLVMLAAFITACDNKSPTDSEYIEVTAIRVPKSIVYLSPSGDTSTYQLETTIIPENATNRKLIYYVSPEDLQYFAIDENGLITAKKETAEGVSIPVKIYSSTNEKAYALVSVVVENATVKELYFDKETLWVQDGSSPFQLNLNFEPYHAQDGRNVTFTSLNTEVLTVDSMGMVTPKQVGIATVIASANTLTGDEKIEANIRIIVGYAPGIYELQVTTVSPQFEQVVNDTQTISFSISRDLYDNIDLNPDIQWYVAGVRVPSQNGEWEFEYTPEENSSPSPPYYISAVITPKGEDPITLQSPHPITLYKPFSGFSLITNEPEGEKYYYSDIISLTPMMEAEVFDWYIKAEGESGIGDYLGTTLQMDSNGTIEFTAQKPGTYIVTAQAKQSNEIIQTKEFIFNVIKYVEGDRIQVIPQTNMEEKIPDSYTWRLHEYDVATQNISAGVLVGLTKRNAPFNYEALNLGWYVLSCTPLLNDQPVLVDNEPMKKYTQPFCILPKEGETEIEYLLIDGAVVDNQYRPVIKWNQTGKVNSFIIELVCGDEIYFIDTSQEDNETGIIYRDYSVILPLSIATLDKDFAVRVKKKDGIYCSRFDYKANTIASKDYEFLEELNYGINGYIQDMKELGDLLNYLITFKPERHLINKLDGEEKYKISVYTKLLYKKVDSNKYPVFEDSPFDDDILTNIYNLTYGAINAYSIKEIKNLDFSFDIITNSFDIVLTIDSNEEYIYQQGGGINNYIFQTNYAEQPRDESFEDFSIQTKSSINVSTSNQLYYAVSNGKKPLPIAGSVAEQIYQQAKTVLNRILSYGMDSFEKVLAINDFLASEVENDSILLQYSLLQPTPNNLFMYDGYHLEGVFLHRKAISLGKSKAFNLLCWMEGISSYLINGQKNGINHSWNKVRIGDNWYNIDTTMARAQRTQGSALSYASFLASDSKMVDIGYVFYGEHFTASEDYNTKAKISSSEIVDTIEELDLVLLNCLNITEQGIYSFGIEFTDSFVTETDIRDLIYERIDEVWGSGEVVREELIQSWDRYFIVLLSKAS